MNQPFVPIVMLLPFKSTLITSSHSLISAFLEKTTFKHITSSLLTIHA